MRRLWLDVFVISLVVSFAGSITVVEAVKYVQSPPLTQVVNSQVGDVQRSGQIRVPVITWGGDIATVHGNGNSSTTAKGSIFDKRGLNVKLVKEDVFPKQVEDYLSGRSPYLRGTLGMVNLALDVISRDPRTRPVVIYQLTESAGGDALVVKPGINTAKDFCGKTIVLQAYGPHVDYMTKVVTDACGSVNNVKIRWTKDLVGVQGDTPGAALHEDKSVDAAFIIIPDANALTSGGKVGTGGEESVKGAKILLSTKTANRVIADVYVVRADYYQSNRSDVEAFVRGLMLAEESLRDLVKNKSSRQAEYKQMITASAKLLMDSDSASAIADTEGMYGDAEFVGFRGNVKFFGDSNYPRNFDKRTAEIQSAFVSLGLMQKRVTLDQARWDYNSIKAGLSDVTGVEVPRFDSQEVAKVIDRRQKQGSLSEGELFSFEVYFKPNQNTFSVDLYSNDFAKVVELAATYGGAVITIEGHSDPTSYVDKKKGGESDIVLTRIKQAAKNLSLTRANAVRDSLVAYAKKKGITIDKDQFVAVGHGIDKPKSGTCGQDPCRPKTEQEWLNNMRVEFRIVNIEAESSAFKPAQ